MVEAEGFEKYLAIKFVGTKRFGLDGEVTNTSFRANNKSVVEI